MDLDISPGQITVLVGASGSGKSTLLDLLAGLREPSSGQILLDGAAVDPDQRLARSSVVFQSTALRPGTLRENVVTTAEPDLARVADLAQLVPVLEALPSGWDSRVGDGANALSGGERQRVGLARALAKPAGLLLVDEATSSLDVITERAVVDSLRTLRGTRTVVAVTHRPALVALADAVIVLDDGRVVDSGRRRRAPGAGRRVRRPLAALARIGGVAGVADRHGPGGSVPVMSRTRDRRRPRCERDQTGSYITGGEPSWPSI